MKYITWILIVLIIIVPQIAVANIQPAPSLETELPTIYESLSQNLDVTLIDRGSLSALDLYGYSGTATLSQGCSAEMPIDFQGTLVLNDASVTFPDNTIVSGTGTCDNFGCTMENGFIGDETRNLKGNDFFVDYDGKIDIFGSAQINHDGTVIEVFDITDLEINDDWTMSFSVVEGSKFGPLIMGGEGTIAFDPLSNTIIPEANGDFIIAGYDPIYTESINIMRENSDVQLQQGMYLTEGVTKLCFVSPCGDSFVKIEPERIIMEGEGFKVKFDSTNPIASALGIDNLNNEIEGLKLEFFEKYGFTEITPEEFEGAFGHILRIEDNDKRDQAFSDFDAIKQFIKLSNNEAFLDITMEGGRVEIESRRTSNNLETQTSLFTISGDMEDNTWATIENGPIAIQIGNNGAISPRLFTNEENQGVVPITLEIIDDFGQSIIKDADGLPMQLTLTPQGEVTFSSQKAYVNFYGSVDCTREMNLITGASIGIIKSQPECIEFYAEITTAFKESPAINYAIEEYEKDIKNPHTFEPEYSQDMESITFMITGNPLNIVETQMDIMGELPSYTQIKAFVGSEDAIDYLKNELPPEIFERITFIQTDLTRHVWVQDLSEGDNEVQVVPLTYLQGAYGGTPSRMNNQEIYQLERSGIEIREVPVEFGGGNVFISKNAEGDSMVLIGADSYLATRDSYNAANMEITEEGYLDIMKNTFNTESATFIGRRDENNNLVEQYQSVFHIDQIMLPIADGVVAMPAIAGSNLDKTEADIEQERSQAMFDFAEANGITYANTELNDLFDYVSNIEFSEDLSYDQMRDIKDEAGGIFLSYIRKESAIRAGQDIKAAREQMEGLGFRIVDLYADAESISSYQAYTNSIIYNDLETGQKTIIMPIFPNEDGEYLMEGLNQKNKEAFEAEGFVVKTVEDHAFRKQGNLHCITLLASNPQDPPQCNLS